MLLIRFKLSHSGVPELLATDFILSLRKDAY